MLVSRTLPKRAKHSSFLGDTKTASSSLGSFPKVCEGLSRRWFGVFVFRRCWPQTYNSNAMRRSARRYGFPRVCHPQMPQLMNICSSSYLLSQTRSQNQTPFMIPFFGNAFRTSKIDFSNPPTVPRLQNPMQA